MVRHSPSLSCLPQEHEILYEKKLAKERATEDDQFGDKDKFVTSAYKKKLAERKAWEEEQRLLDEEDERNDVTKKTDFSGFFKYEISNGRMLPDLGTNLEISRISDSSDSEFVYESRTEIYSQRRLVLPNQNLNKLAKREQSKKLTRKKKTRKIRVKQSRKTTKQPRRTTKQPRKTTKQPLRIQA